MDHIPEIPEAYKSLVAPESCRQCMEDGTIELRVKLLVEMAAKERGEFLLDLEDELCKSDPRIRVWHVALGDKNSLRNLRGISVD